MWWQGKLFFICIVLLFFGFFLMFVALNSIENEKEYSDIAAKVLTVSVVGVVISAISAIIRVE